MMEDYKPTPIYMLLVCAFPGGNILLGCDDGTSIEVRILDSVPQALDYEYSPTLQALLARIMHWMERFTLDSVKVMIPGEHMESDIDEQEFRHICSTFCGIVSAAAWTSNPNCLVNEYDATSKEDLDGIALIEFLVARERANQDGAPHALAIVDEYKAKQQKQSGS